MKSQPFRYLLATSLLGTSAIAQAQGFSAIFSAQDLDGSNGFRITGSDSGDTSGSFVKDAGDVNGDGIADIVISAPNAGPYNGTVYVVFGSEDWGSFRSLNLADLDGSNGFSINATNHSSHSLSIGVGAPGDINGDGFDDVAIINSDLRLNGVSSSQITILFGGNQISNDGSLNLVSEFDGSNGFIINAPTYGIFPNLESLGDVNDDGVDDFIVKGRFSDNASAYVVFGEHGIDNSGPLNLSDLNGDNGFKFEGNNGLNGIKAAGDINGDGVDDIILGDAYDSSGYDSHIVFGGNSLGSTGSVNFSNLNGNNGFTIRSENRNTGSLIDSAGDFNGDGIEDIIIGGASPYLIFGANDIGNSGLFELAQINGQNGFLIRKSNGIFYASSVSTAGDVNGDGFNDVIIGNHEANPTTIQVEYEGGTEDGDTYSAGTSYILFGGDSVGSSRLFDLAGLDGNNGFEFEGLGLGDEVGFSVSGAGDVNSDGIDDVIIGAPFANLDPEEKLGRLQGASYVIFGAQNNLSPPANTAPNNDQFSNAEPLNGISDALASGTTAIFKGSNVGAATEANEPAHSGKTSGHLRGPRNSIWYRWTANANQAVEIDTVGSSEGTVLLAYTGDTLAELNQVAKAMNNTGGVSRIRFAALAGETYHFAVDGFGNNSEGSIRLNVRQPAMDLLECTILGTNEADTLTGTAGVDVICGMGGNDTIRSLGGPDIIFAGSGDDSVSSSGGHDVVFGEDGKDVLIGGSGEDLLLGGDLVDRLFGGKDNDIVFGGTGADRLYGADGNDKLFGEVGSDRLVGGDGDDVLDGGNFTDTCEDTIGVNTLVDCE